MTTHKILRLNALITAASAAAMLLARPVLFPLFGLSTPMWLDVTAAVFVLYAAALALVAGRASIHRAALVAFTIGDSLCFVASLAVLVVFWSDLAPVARVLVVMTAVVVDVFAMAQYRAAKAAQ
jgi:hypothetical protein